MCRFYIMRLVLVHKHNLLSNNMAKFHIVEQSANKVLHNILMNNYFFINQLFAALNSRDDVVFSDINVRVSAARYWPRWSHSNSLWTVPEHGFQPEDLKEAIPSVDSLFYWWSWLCIFQIRWWGHYFCRY